MTIAVDLGRKATKPTNQILISSRELQNLIKSILQPNEVCDIRIFHECEGRIENNVARITVWNHKACGVMTNVDRGGRIFLSHPHHMNNLFFFFLAIKYLILCLCLFLGLVQGM